VIAKGNKLSSLYVLENKAEVGVAMVVVDSGMELWHKRLGHMSKRGLEVMLKRDQLHALKSHDLEMCEHCLYGKQRRTSFLTTGHYKKSTPLELVHSNVFGPTEVTSILFKSSKLLIFKF